MLSLSFWVFFPCLLFHEWLQFYNKSLFHILMFISIYFEVITISDTPQCMYYPNSFHSLLFLTLSFLWYKWFLMQDMPVPLWMNPAITHRLVRHSLVTSLLYYQPWNMHYLLFLDYSSIPLQQHVKILVLWGGKKDMLPKQKTVFYLDYCKFSRYFLLCIPSTLE